jgi:hypothetical protein
MSCVNLANSVRPGCNAKKKPGGTDKRIFFGLLEAIASVTFGTYNSVETLTFLEGMGLIEYDLKKDKNSATMALEVGENANLRNHVVNAVVNWDTEQELAALEDLIDAEGIFAIVEQNGGNLEVYGLNKGANFNNFGLKASALDGSTGVVLNDPTAFNVSLSGQHTNLQLLYKPSQTLTANLAELEALVIDPVSS